MSPLSLYSDSAISSVIVVLSLSTFFSLYDLLLDVPLDLWLDCADPLLNKPFIDTNCHELSCPCLSILTSFIQLSTFCLNEQMLWSKSTNHFLSLSCFGANNKELYDFWTSSIILKISSICHNCALTASTSPMSPILLHHLCFHQILTYFCLVHFCLVLSVAPLIWFLVSISFIWCHQINVSSI